MKVNPKLILSIVCIIAGIVLILVSRDKKTDTQEQLDSNRVERYVGVAVLLLGVGLGSYFYHNGEISFSANMPPSCQPCKNYMNRSKRLIPYKPGEYRTLSQQSQNCETCFNMCEDEINLLKKHTPVDHGLINMKKKSCIDIGTAAVTSKKQLERLAGDMKGKQIQYARAVHEVGGKPFFRL